MPNCRISELSSPVGVSDDTVRRRAASGRLPRSGVVAAAAVQQTGVVVEVPQR